MSASRFILLDTMVVGGIFAVSKPNSESEKQNRAEWRRSIEELRIKGGIQKASFIVPTPVCYELMCLNKEWTQMILGNRENLFPYASRNISGQVLKKAADFSIESKVEFTNNESFKSKSLDPIIAAYSLIQGHYIITENQKDYPESHFQVLAMEPVIINGQKGKLRKILLLLKPKTQHL